MQKEKDVSRQTMAHRVKMWTLTLYNAKGEAFLVSKKHCMKNPSKDKKSG